MIFPMKKSPLPYFAVIFTSVRTDGDNGYSEMAKQMLKLASEQPGFLGFEHARQEIGISVSYWESLQAIAAWKANMTHRQAQNRAKDWYSYFRVRICRVEREYGL
jgi:heme-degrading monooxygenase HmoA